jgi:hypothetical protein
MRSVARMKRSMLLLRRAFALAGISLLGSAAVASAEISNVELAPHRAVYALTLDDTGAGTNVSDIRGELIYEFKGSSCEGYTLNTRLFTEIFDREGKPSVTDIRSKTWESGDGSRFRFDTSQFANSKLSDSTKGSAARKRDSVVVELEKPKRGTLRLPGKVFFPTQHSITLIRAALEGRNRVQADIYDGSEKGLKVYETTTVIGAAIAGAANSKLPRVKNADALDGVASWPVVVSYYDGGDKKDALPSYEISFRMYANGVSRKLRLDYGTFALTGDLSSIEFFPAKSCPEPNRSVHLRRLR